MKIYLKHLEVMGACKKGLTYFIKNWGEDGSPDHKEISEKLQEDKNKDAFQGWMFKYFMLTGKVISYESNEKIYSTSWYVDGIVEHRTMPMPEPKK